MAKKPLVPNQRDQRSLNAARDGIAVTLRLALLRRLDRRTRQPTALPKRLLLLSSITTLGVIATNFETFRTHLEAIVGR